MLLFLQDAIFLRDKPFLLRALGFMLGFDRPESAVGILFSIEDDKLDPLGC